MSLADGGCRSSAAAEERIFRNCILAGLRPAGSHCKNNLILTSGSIPHLRLGVSCKERIYHLLSPKGAPKVSAEHLRRDRTEQCGICGALRATMIICWSPVLAGLRPAGSHCEKSGKIPTLHCIPFGTTNPVILRRKSKPIPTQASPPASPRKQRRKRPCPIGFRHICPKTEK